MFHFLYYFHFIFRYLIKSICYFLNLHWCSNIAQEKLSVQCWSILHKHFHTKRSTMLSGSVWAKIAQGNHLCNVCPWLTDNIYEENNLYIVVLTMLGQYYIRILSSQCCPNMSERTLHKKITCTMLTQSAQTHFRRRITYTMLSWSACANIAHENYLCNVDPKPKNNFATWSGPTLHKEITYVMFAHG